MEITVKKELSIKGVKIQVDADLYYENGSMDFEECTYTIDGQDVYTILSEEALNIADDLILIYANQKVR